jgi:hypothetical protein
MVATKFIIMAMAACAKATPVASAPNAETTEWTGLPIENLIDWNDVDMDAYKNHSNWNTTVNNNVTVRPAKLPFKIRKGACDQGTCPDYSAQFDLVYTFSATDVPGPAPDPHQPPSPPLTLYHGGSDIRVNDCGQCYRREVGSGLGVNIPGGCWDFTSCNRAQVICVDPGKNRAHRIWKDNGDKKCYGMKVERLGSCGPVKTRVVIHHDADLPCNW